MLLLFLVFVLALGPQVVLSGNFKFSFSEVQQCEPLSISFQGDFDPTDPAPVSLSILPFNGNVVSIPVPESTLNSTGLNVSFLPLPADTNFIASLDDAAGDNAARISDINKVFASQDASCVPQSTNSFTPSFTILDPISQCEKFSVRYENGIAPTIRLFFPKLGSFPLNKIDDDPENSTATYLMAAPRQSQVVLMFNDTVVVQSSALLPGDTSSSRSCFPQQNNMQPGNTKQAQSSKSGVSKPVAIGLGVGFGVLALLAIPMIWYVIRERRRNRKAMQHNNEPGYFEKSSHSYDSSEKRGYSTDSSYENHVARDLPSLPEKPARPPAPPPFFTYNSTSFERKVQTRSWNTEDGFVKDPAYVSYASTISGSPRSSISWEMVTSGDNNGGLRRQNSTDSRRSQRDTKTILPSTTDLEHMLDVARDDVADGSAPVSRNPSHTSQVSRNARNSSRSWGSTGNIVMPSTIPTRVRSGTNSISFPAMNPIQDVPQNVSFLAETSVDEHGMPVFYESPMSMGSHLRSSQASFTQLQNPGRLGSRFSAVSTASDDSMGQIIQVHLQRPQPSLSSTNNSSAGAEDGHEPGSSGSFRFPQPTHYSPSPLARALERNSSISMESWGNTNR
ncbi:hypothetical protein K435DRAFT_116203 [Dendrothele bispora CBS 962.96]|uniref:Mid2 domain-containing protein n=1 Tax=Dendrothele bispora (strain CBS 962.96) TaxID=1314807 RepID=A0A4S8MS75_DENBC|nr:hypothetical protein K435DRAFT_116203 [Dendrothele bispora CBS 962.96]